MHVLDDLSLDQFIKEDVPYFDLTTTVAGIGDKPGKIQFFSREQTVLCGTEEVSRILEKCQAQVSFALPTGTKVSPGELLLEARGPAQGLHRAWKVSVNLLEYASGIATRTHRLVAGAKAARPDVQVVTTRKTFPGTKALSVKAILAGGAMPHRLGLSETILIFHEHMAFLGGFRALLDQLPRIRSAACEKKVLVEVKSVAEGVALARKGVDGIQFDKLSCPLLAEAVTQIRAIDPHILLIGTGGIYEGNVAEYAATGIDTINTTAVYFGKPADIGIQMTCEA